MHVTADVKTRVAHKLKEGIAIAKREYGVDLPMPQVQYTKRGTTAGVAHLREWIINLNPVLLMQNVDTFLQRTVPHELAHLITERVYPEAHKRIRGAKREPHGEKWQSVMRKLGAPVSRCHSYDVSDARVKRNITTYTYQCPKCQHIYTLGAKRHKRHQEAPAYGYSCGKCGRAHKLVYVSANHPTTTVAVAPVKTVKTTTVVSTTGKSKLDVCKALYAANSSTLTRQQMIQLFVSKAGCTPAGASTYYATCKKG